MSAEDKMQRVSNIEDVLALVSEAQRVAFICNSLRHQTIGDKEEISFDLYKQGENSIRFTIYVVDIPKDRRNSQYAGFIVPLGRSVFTLYLNIRDTNICIVLDRMNGYFVVLMDESI